jgi:hypothetical protein
VTVELRGKALSLDELVTLKRAGSADVVGTALSVSPDRRALSVTFNLLTAAAGAWDVVVTGPAHAPKVIPNGFSVTAAVQPEMKVALVGRNRFVPGRVQTLTISYENRGNIDALGVPVFVHGLPAGTIVEPKFEMSDFDRATGTYSPHRWDQSKTVYPTGDGSLEFVVLLGRVPGGGKGTLTYSVTIPSQSNYTLKVYSGACFNRTAPSTPLSGLHNGTGNQISTGLGGNDCLGAMVGIAANFIPGAACASFAAGLAAGAVQDAVSGTVPYTEMDAVGIMTTGLSAAACVSSVFPGGSVVSGVLGALGAGIGAAKSGWDLGSNCSDDVENLDQQWVTSMDPNEIIGPIGGSASHAIPGRDKLTYAIYFENKSTATAPAQEVRISDVLDPTVFDLTTVEFGRVQWGTNSYVPPAGSSTLEDVVDLRPSRELKVGITATKADDGTLAWLLRSIDPVTGTLPEDPDVGFLPPNDAQNSGQGVVYVSVALKSPVDGQNVTNTATVIFDLNAPIVTNTWSNLIDTTPASSKVAALPAQSTSHDIAVTWSGTDATSGIAAYAVSVSKDGGDYTLWKQGTTATSGTYQGEVGHTYAFTSVAIDNAGNIEPFPALPDATTSLVDTLVLAPAVPPTVSGAARVGSRLTASVGVWNTAVTASYQWLRNGSPIAGARASSYVPVAADLGARVAVTVTVTANGYAPRTVTTAGSIVALGAAPRATKSPTIVGKARVGKKLSAKPGSWSVGGLTFTYTWWANGKRIAKATRSQLVVGARLAGKRITVLVTAKARGYATGTARSKATAAVKR